MARKRRLHYKDLDALRFVAFLPVFLYCALFLMSSEENPVIAEAGKVMSFVSQNSIDFFFFLSAFLLTSHALREIKYNKGFGFKAFYIRRMMRILPLFALALIFAFVIHPYIVKILAFEPIQTPNFVRFFTHPPRFASALSKEQYIYLSVIWTIFMFIQFYAVWGFVLKFFLQHIKYVSYLLIAIGIGDRAVHVLFESSYQLDVLTAGVPIGIGAFIANVIRNDERTIELIKHLTQVNHLIIYLTGGLVVALGYVFFGNTYLAAIVPVLTCTFYGYVVLEQTYGKTSLFKMHKSRFMTRLGKISYGMIVYQSIILVIVIISIDALNMNLGSIAIQTGFLVICFFITWIVADVSFTIFERPIYAIKKEFKHS